MNAVIVFYVVLLASWVANLIKLLMCDFEGPWKEEIIHLVGLVIPIASPVTMWF